MYYILNTYTNLLPLPPAPRQKWTGIREIQESAMGAAAQWQELWPQPLHVSIYELGQCKETRGERKTPSAPGKRINGYVKRWIIR